MKLDFRTASDSDATGARRHLSLVRHFVDFQPLEIEGAHFFFRANHSPHRGDGCCRWWTVQWTPNWQIYMRAVGLSINFIFHIIIYSPLNFFFTNKFSIYILSHESLGARPGAVMSVRASAVCCVCVCVRAKIYATKNAAAKKKICAPVIMSSRK